MFYFVSSGELLHQSPLLELEFKGDNVCSIVVQNWKGKFRDVGSISNLGGTALRGHFFLKETGHFLRIKRALLCSLQNLEGGTCPQCTRL